MRRSWRAKAFNVINSCSHDPVHQHFEPKNRLTAVKQSNSKNCIGGHDEQAPDVTNGYVAAVQLLPITGKVEAGAAPKAEEKGKSLKRMRGALPRDLGNNAGTQLFGPKCNWCCRFDLEEAQFLRPDPKV